jgi:hypothetical protein
MKQAACCETADWRGNLKSKKKFELSYDFFLKRLAELLQKYKQILFSKKKKIGNIKSYTTACCLLQLVSCLAHSSTLKTDATCYSGTLVDFQRSARLFISEDRNLKLVGCVMIQLSSFS